MSDKGTMISLRIDMERIRELAPLHQETVLAGNGQMAAIAAPAEGEFRCIADKTQRELRQLTGTVLPILDESGYARADALSSSVVAIGHAGNNHLLRRLHYLKYLDNGDYPSEGLRLVSVHSPFGDGRNVLAALGYTAESARQSASRLRELIVERDGSWLVAGRIKVAEPRPETSEPEDLLRSARKESATGSGRPTAILTALRNLNVAGEERWARAFTELVRPYATGESPLSFWLMSAVDFWTQGLATSWDSAEEWPYFTDEERRLVTNFVASCTEYCHDSITYQKWRLADTEHQVFNHHTFPASGLYFGTRYLRVHGYEIEGLDTWRDKSLRIFARAAEAGRSFDEGGSGYSWLVGNHLLDVSLAHGDTSYASSEKMKRYADLAVVIQNNDFELVPFGDCGSYHSTGTSASNILLRAAEWHQEPGYKWVAERHFPAAAQADVLAREIPSAPPTDHVGLFILPLDPVVHRWAGLPRFPNYPPPIAKPNVPVDQCFDKLSLRSGWEPHDDYLLLQGFGDGQHGHPDANAISQYQVRGRWLLAESDYIRRMPKHHNMVMIIRDGAHAPIPTTARLDSATELPGGALTMTSLVDYNGCDWTRTLIWLTGDCLLCVDSIRVKIAGDYGLRCYWRTLGDASLTERGLHADHQGEHFHIVELTDSHRRLDVESMQLGATEYPHYRFGDGRPKVLCERRWAQLAAGEEVCFVNLLLPNGETETPRRSIEWREAGTIFVTGEGPDLTVQATGVEVRGNHRHTFDERERLSALEAPAGTNASRGVELPPTAATRGWQATLPAPATCLTWAEEESALVGCEDGSILEVGRDGAVQYLATADGRIGSVLAGCLYGEQELTYLAAGHDAKLRLLRPKRGERLTVELPRNGHMPAWGRALCLADLDGDGRLWPIVGTASWRVHAVLPDGAFRWTVDTASHSVTCLASGDLNADGRDEIAVGTVYFCVPAITPDGQRLWQDEDYNDYWQAGPNFPFIEIADVDGDGDLEVITVGADTLVHCISNVGEKKRTHSIGDEAAGLAVTRYGIVAASQTGDVHLLDGRGERIWRLRLGSPCTALAVADERLCVGTETGEVVWVTATGEPVSRCALPSPALKLLGRADGAVLAATDDGLTEIWP